MLIKRIATFLILIPAICSRTYCMDNLLRKTIETVRPLTKAVLETTIKNHSKSLAKKDFSKLSTENLGNINYCACYLLDTESFDKYSISVTPRVLQKSLHTETTKEGITIFISGRGDSPIEDRITDAFYEYYSIVFGHPLTKLFPVGEFHIRKADSEQKMLYALEDRDVFSALKTQDTDRSMLAYKGKTLIVYTLRNTCPFCNVALGGFLAKQICEYVSGEDSLGIRNIHVFYSFDDTGSDRSVHKETERLQESMLLIQPNITYTQLSIGTTVQLMIDFICSSSEIAEQYLELIKQIYFTSSNEVKQMILNTFISNMDLTKLDSKTIERYLSIINELPESSFRNDVLNTYLMLNKILHLESSSNIDEKLSLSEEINLTVLPDFIDIIKTKIRTIISNLAANESANEKISTLIMNLRQLIDDI